MTTRIRVLILEDKPADAELMLHELRKAGFAPDWRRVDCEPEYLAGLDPALDLILADYNLPQYDAMRALRGLHEKNLNIPFIIVTGTISEEVAVECIKQGAADYLLKDRMGRLGPAVIQVLEQWRLREEKRKADELLELQSKVIEAAANAIIITDQDGRIAWVNPAFTGLTGYSFSEVWGQNPRLLKSGSHDPSFYQELWTTILAGRIWRGEVINRRKDGSLYTEEMTITPVHDARAKVSHFIAIKQDVSARKQAEEEIRSLAKFASESPYPILRLDHDGKILYANGASEALLQQWGCAVGAPAPPEWRETVRETLASRSGRFTDVQCGERIYSLFVAAIPEAGYVNLYGRDITARRQAEEALRRHGERLSVLHEIDRAILAAQSPEAIAKAALAHIRRLLPCQRASVILFDFRGGVATLLAVNVDGETQLGVGTRFSLDEFPLGETIRQGKLDMVEDLRNFVRPPPMVQTLRAEGIQSLMGVPLVTHGEVIGSLNVGANRPHAFTSEDREVVSEVADQLALTIQQSRLHAMAVRRGEELLALLGASKAVMAGLDLQETLERIIEQAALIAGTDHVKVLLLDRETGVLRIGAHRGAVYLWPALPGRVTLSGITAQTGELVFSANISQDPRNPFARQDREIGFVTHLSLPVKKGDETLGVLTFNTKYPREYTPDELAYLGSFADQAAIAIEHAQLFSDQQRAAREARSLYEVAHSLATSLNVNEVLDLIARKTMELVGTSHAQVSLWDEAAQLLRVGAVHGTQADKIRSHVWRLGEGVNGIVAQTRTPLVVNDYQNFPHRIPEFTELVADLSVPLLYRGQLLGVLNSHSTEPGWTFKREQLDLLTSFADQAAVALENARLYEQLQSHAAELEQKVQDRTVELAAANQQLQEASRNKSEFLANMSHELRTPLNSVIGFSELLQDQRIGSLDEKQARYVAHISTAGKHLVQLIGDILDISKVEAGKFVLQTESISVVQTLGDILVIARGLANKKAQEIQTDIAADLPPLTADPVRFKQILFNLLSNAVKFTPEKGTITLRARQVPDDCRLPIADCRLKEPGDSNPKLQIENRQSGIREFLEIAVTDTGVGIKAEDLPRLFREFVQLETTQAQKQEGTGLGLALTKRLVELHGGRIWVDSEGEGRGSTFTVVLPFAGSEEARG